MRKVITYGTFDMLHVGHLLLLERLRALGDHLTVAVSTDEFNAGKGKKSVIPFEDRARLVSALRCVDEVVPETSWDQKGRDVVEFGIHVFGIGDDWQGHFDFLTPLCDVVYLPRTPGVSTTLLKGWVRAGLPGAPELANAPVEEAREVS